MHGYSYLGDQLNDRLDQRTDSEAVYKKGINRLLTY